MARQYSREAFKRSIVEYASGRLLNALAAFSIFVWIARQLPATEYAYYVAAFALVEISLVIAGFGMEWVTAVYLPQVRLNATTRELRRFVWECAGIQAITLFMGAALYFFLAARLADFLGIPGAASAFRLYAVVMAIEGMGRVFRDQLLSCLLLQGAAQVSQLLRNICLFALVVWIFSYDHLRTAEGLALAELAASGLSMCFAAFMLARYLWSTDAGSARAAAWDLPRWRDLLRVARNAWISNLANLTWNWSSVVLIVTKAMGADATAALGFTRNLAEQIRRYMPMEFLLGIVRTLLVVRYTQDGDTTALGGRVSLMYKANLLLLAPLLVACVTQGDEICRILSGGRYVSAHWFLVGWLSVMVALAHHRLTDVLAHALDRSELTTRASLMLTVVPVGVFVSASFANWSLMFAILFAAEIVYSFLVLDALRAPGWIYVPDWKGLAKIAMAAGIAYALLEIMPATPAPVADIVISIGLSYLVVFAIAILLQAWSVQETRILPIWFKGWAGFGRDK